MASGSQAIDFDWVAWGHADELESFDSGWHAHQEHQLLHASAGNLRVELAGERWLLPPGRGAWIQAGLAHRVETARASLRTLYVHPAFSGATEQVCVFSMEPLAREMMRYARRWPREEAQEPLARSYFEVLLGLFAQEWQHQRWDFALPTPESQELVRAAAHVDANLADATLESAARAAFISPRTLTRRFKQELKTTWKRYLHQARMIEAMVQLERGVPVGQVAFEVGFSSPSAFTKSFREFAGQLPSEVAQIK